MASQQIGTAKQFLALGKLGTRQMARNPWVASRDRIDGSAIVDFAQTAIRSGAYEGDPNDYEALRSWSVRDIAGFWSALADYFDVKFAQPPSAVVTTRAMPGVQWFPGSQLNFTDHVGRNVSDSHPAVVLEVEGRGPTATMTYGQLRSYVESFAAHLADTGVKPGDRVVGYLPNCFEGIIAMLGTAAVGAVWAQVGMDYGTSAAYERLGQLDPVVLISGTGYTFGGRQHDCRQRADDLRRSLTSLRSTVVVRTAPFDTQPAKDSISTWDQACAHGGGRKALSVPFGHPLWVLFTSGTTGRPKGVIHSHGGALLEQLKCTALHLDIGPTDRYFWYTTPNWMMWNAQLCGLLTGATIVLFDGKPIFPTPRVLWDIVERHQITVFGVSPGFLQASIRAGIVPAQTHDLSALKTLGVTGSVLPASVNRWVESSVGAGVQVASTSGGTDVVGAFVASAPNTPVYPGEISARALGVALEAWDDEGKPVTDHVGEMVITQPMPSMPLGLWNDPDLARYRDAYFSRFPGVWRQGDWITLTGRGTVIMHGRSDAVLNRGGVRLGSAEICAAAESLSDVEEALVVGIEQADGGYWMPMFIVASVDWDDVTSADRVRQEVRRLTSKQHVPDEIIVVPSLPHTRTGKKMEVPVKRILQGFDARDVAGPDAVDDYESLNWFVEFAHDRATRVDWVDGPGARPC